MTDDQGMRAIQYKRVSHIAIAVWNLDEAVAKYGGTLGLQAAHIEEVPQQKVKLAMIPVGESRLEILQATDPESAVAKFVETHGEGIHHIALEVDNIEESLRAVAAKGARLIDAAPRIGAEGAKIAFIHPKSCNGVLIELIEPKKN